MWVTLEDGADAGRVRGALTALGLWTRPLAGPRPGFEVERHGAAVDPARVRAIPGVADVWTRASPHPRVDARAGAPVLAHGHAFGGDAPGARPPVLLAGPCAVESEEQVHAAAALCARAGARFLRGGAFKPRTSPDAFAGHGRPALTWLVEAARAHGLGVVTECLSEADVDAVAAAADILQVGARSMQSFALLRAIGRAGRPVLLKRGRAARLEEWLLAAEHLLAAGCPGVVLCERGVVGFDATTRDVLDLATAALVRRVHGLPVVVDPSHAAGRRDLIAPLAAAARALGADGVLVEVHPDAAEARSDGPQALDADGLAEVAAAVLGRAGPRWSGAGGAGPGCATGDEPGRPARAGAGEPGGAAPGASPAPGPWRGREVVA